MAIPILNRFLGKVFNAASVAKTFLPPTGQDKARIQELRQAVRQLPPIEMRGGSYSEKAWINNLQRIRALMLSRDPRRFLRWDVIGQTMFIHHADYIGEEYVFLRQRKDWATRWQSAIRESSVGCPMPYRQNLSTSATLIHHAYHLARFEEKASTSISDMDCICEVGGGYGGMCRLVHHLGFQGTYVIFDLPEFCALQRYYLQSLGLPVWNVQDFRATPSGIVCTPDLDKFTALLEDVQEETRSLFLATWSLSETPIALRNSILPSMNRFGQVLIAYQDRFGQIDNVAFFKEWIERHPERRWQHWHIDHIPNNFYIIGQTRAVPSKN